MPFCLLTIIFRQTWDPTFVMFKRVFSYYIFMHLIHICIISRVILGSVEFSNQSFPLISTPISITSKQFSKCSSHLFQAFTVVQAEMQLQIGHVFTFLANLSLMSTCPFACSFEVIISQMTYFYVT